ncbi:MAG: RnfABCDGE type electron transport complex subunit B [Planctomycetes bacterium]|nr:RnfABCDGE type electron transport complex subunit B [Planctomycetota bacterium]
MDWSYVTAAAVVLGSLAVLFGVGLAVASRVFRVHSDPRTEQIEGILPSANCGACGYGGCAAYAAAVVAGQVGPSECVPGGIEVARQVAEIMGLVAEEKEKQVAVVICQGGNRVTDRFRYQGVADCRAAMLTQDGAKGCRWGCIGLGTCAKVCPFGAIVMGEDGLPHVIEEKCTACGTCVDACPKQVIRILPAKSMVQVLCRSRDKGADVRKVCSVGCIGCKKCESVCPVEGKAVHVTDFLARVDVETCISCGKCVKACPMGTIGNFRLSRRPRKGKLPDQQEAA